MFNEIKKVITEWNVSDLFTVNKSEMVLTCANGYQAISKGLDDVEKLKSIIPQKGILTDVWIEEATEIREDDLKQLSKRLRGRANVKKRISLSFNPILRAHWIFKKFFMSLDSSTVYCDDKLSILKTIYKDNKFLAQDDIEELENEEDTYWRDVYTLGNWGTLGDVIFKNWKIGDIPEEQKKGFDNIRNGLDFGFSTAPSAYVRMNYDKKTKTIHIFEELFVHGFTNPQLAEALKPIINNERLICDSSEPKSIQELRDHKVNAIGADRGKDSVNFGIQFIQQHEVIIDSSLQNLINEFQFYQWKKNKQGESLPIPVDKANHGIDAMRYALEGDMDNRIPGLFFLGASKNENN